jgi:phosphoglycerate dehydrogenase-like enzyme
LKNILVDVDVHPPLLQQLRSLSGVTVEVLEEHAAPWTLPQEHVRDKHALFCHLPPTNLAELQELEWIQIASSGYAQVVGLGLPARGIRVCNAAGVFDTAIAEWNVAMMINLIRDMRAMMHNQDAGVWDRDARHQREIRGSVAGIWGYGGIARETARLLKAMGVRVHVLVRDGVKPRDRQFALPGAGDIEGVLPDRVFTAAETEPFLSGLDFLIVAVPLTKHTRGMIGPRELRALPPRAYLLNPARGPIVQEEALLRALREQWIAGAALDTHYTYPMPPDHPLWKMPNVIMTPHISGSSANPCFLSRVWDIFAQNVSRSLKGEPLLNELTAAQLNDE